MRSLWFWLVIGVAVLGPRPAAAQGVREFGAAPVTALAFSPAGDLLATAGADRVVRTWRLDGTLEWATPALPAAVTAIAFRPNGMALAVGDGSGLVTVWGPGPDRSLTVTAHSGSVCALAYTSDGATMISGGQDCHVKLWDMASGASRRGIGPLPVAPITLALSPDNEWLAMADAHGVALYEARTFKFDRALPCPEGSVSSVAFSPDGRHLAAACGEGALRMWTRDEFRVSNCSGGHRSRVQQLSFDATGRRLCSVGQNGQTVVWDVAGSRALFSHRFPAPAFCGAICPSGEAIAAGTSRPRGYLLDLPRNVR